MFAYVRFRDDNHKAVIETKEFRSFKPRNIHDFTSSKWYEVFWEDEKQSGYFKAQVVRLYETKDEAEKCGKRVPVPPPPSDSDESCESECSVQEVTKVAPRSSKTGAEKKFRTRQLALLDESDDENERLRAENKRLQERVEMLEKALCSKIFKTERRLFKNAAGPAVSACRKSLQAVVMAPPEPPELSYPTSRHDMETQARPANVCILQGSLPDEPVECLASPAPPPPEVADLHTEAAGSNGTGNAPAQEQMGPFSVSGSEVFLGDGVWLPVTTYERLMGRHKDSVFVREASVAIFSSAGLIGRSVTGNVSNRTKADPKPPLDPAKLKALSAFFKHYLEQRCSGQHLTERHRSLGRTLAMKIADVTKSQILKEK